MAYSVEKIENIQDFKKLRDIWNELLSNKTSYRPFLDHDWFELWLNHFQNKQKLLILLVKDEYNVKAIFPLVIKNEKFTRIQVNKVELIGNIYSPIRNILIAELCDAEKVKVLSTLFTFLVNSVKWDLIDLNSLPEENFDFTLVDKGLKETGLRSNVYFCYKNWYLDKIRYSAEEYFKSRPKIIRKDVPYCQRRLEKVGRLKFELIKGNNEIDRYIDMYHEVYSNSWQEREDVGPNFHRDLAKLASRKGTLRLGFLFLDNVPISSQFWIVNNQTAYILKTVYDHNQRIFSPGKILTMLMVQYAIDVENIKEIDYLHGDDNYKKDWVPYCRDRKGILIFNKTLRGTILSCLLIRILPVINRSASLKAIKDKVVKHVL